MSKTKTTAQELLNDKPTVIEVERVENLWRGFNSTTQFLLALKQVLGNYDHLLNEVNALTLLLPVLAQVEATELDMPFDNEPNGNQEFFPIAQR